jgi:hypothetical protein
MVFSPYLSVFSPFSHLFLSLPWYVLKWKIGNLTFFVWVGEKTSKDYMLGIHQTKYHQNYQIITTSIVIICCHTIRLIVIINTRSVKFFVHFRFVEFLVVICPPTSPSLYTSYYNISIINISDYQILNTFIVIWLSS